MTVIVLPAQKVETSEVKTRLAETRPFGTYTIASIVCNLLFIAYIGSYQTRIFSFLITSPAIAILCVVIAPALAFIFSIISLKHGIKAPLEVRGMSLAYSSFIFSALYFAVALAIPLVLLILYFVYTYIW